MTRKSTLLLGEGQEHGEKPRLRHSHAGEAESRGEVENSEEPSVMQLLLQAQGASSLPPEESEGGGALKVTTRLRPRSTLDWIASAPPTPAMLNFPKEEACPFLCTKTLYFSLRCSSMHHVWHSIKNYSTRIRKKNYCQETKQSTEPNPEMTHMLELSDGL